MAIKQLIDDVYPHKTQPKKLNKNRLKL